MSDASPLSLRAAGVQLHQQVAVLLRDAVSSGRFAPGERIPSESELCTRFSVSRVTLRRALQVLREEGFLKSRQGKGTFVTAAPPVRSLPVALADLEASLKSAREATRPKLILFERAPTPIEVRELFGSDCTDQVLRVERVHLHGARPLMRSVAYYPDKVACLLDRRQFSRLSAFEVLERAGLKRHNMKVTIGASLADTVTGKQLDVPVGSALVEGYRFSTDRSGSPLEYMVWQANPLIAPYRISVEGGGAGRMSDLPEC